MARGQMATRVRDDVLAEVDYAAVFQALGFPLAMLTVEGPEARFVEINETFARMTRLSRRRVVGRPLADVLDPEIAAMVGAGAVRAAEMGEPVRIEAQLAVRGGSHAVILTPMSEAGAERLVLLDAERRLTARLPGARGHSLAFDRLAHVNTGLIYILDVQQGRTLYVAKGLAAMVGRGRGEGFGVEDLLDLAHADDRPEVAAHIAAMRVIDDAGVAQASFRLPRGDGGWLWLESRARVLARDRKGRVRRVLGVVTDVTEFRSMADALQTASKALLAATESERRRVGRELHDSTAQHLVAIDLGLGALQRRLPEDATDAARIVRDIKTSLAAAHREIRAMSYLLHPPILKRRGLVETLRVFAEGFGRRTGLALTLVLPTRPRPLPEEVEIVIFRIAQEALMNVYRHADARAVSLTLTFSKTAALMEVEDDGVGMLDAAPGVGIAGMSARLAQLGGSLVLEPRERGTRLRASLPLPMARRR